MADRPQTTSSQKLRRVVIVGAGFAGLRAARELAKAPAEVVLIDRNNYHEFQPLLYQVATAGIEPEEIAYPIRAIFRRRKRIHFLLGSVQAVEPKARRLILRDAAPVPYDYLVIAAGAMTNFFGVEGAEEYALPMKVLPDAIHLRNHILRQFERCELARGKLPEGALNFVVAGGGPTGVEIAGQLVELFERVLPGDFRHIDTSRARVIMVEMLPEVLMPFDRKLREYTRRELERRGVEVRTETTVERVTADAVHLKGGERIPAETVIWAAGVKATPLGTTLGTEHEHGRLVVKDDLSIPEYAEIFVAGDLCGGNAGGGEAYPQLATVAIQQGRHAGRQVLRRLDGKPTEAFAYTNPGIMATIGRSAAVAQLPGGLQLTGFVAWTLWAVLHIMKLVGFRNRASVFFSWAYNYITYDFSARLILDVLPVPEELLQEAQESGRNIRKDVEALEVSGSDENRE